MTYVDSLRLEQLLEHHTVVRMLASRYADTVRLEGFAYSSVSEDIIWGSRLLDEPTQKVRS